MLGTDTVASITTGLSNAGISIIRISGPEAFTIIDKVYQSKSKDKKISQQKSHTIHYGYIVSDKKIIDEVMVSIFRTPTSYTREDTVEINCHGGVVVTQKVLEIVLNHGARIAEPGEFTKRAFLNGRIDLSQAEAVMDMINAKNELALKNSMNQLKGGLHDIILELRDIIIKDIAFIEASLDDPEHISLDNFNDSLLLNIIKIKNKISELIRNSYNGKIIKEGIKTVIVGKPNVGKSSLLNILVGEERAIVTDIAGTTRDTLEENINLNGISLNIIDTAGIRQTADYVEQIGIDRTFLFAENADLIIYVIDGSTALDDNDRKIINLVKDKNTIILLNKSDLEQKVDYDEIKKQIDKEIINISAKNKSGINRLEEKIKDMFFDGKIDINDDIYITNKRHVEALSEAIEGLNYVEQSIKDGMPEDFYSIDLINSYEALGKIIGENIGEDLVNTIFSEFCMGK